MIGKKKNFLQKSTFLGNKNDLKEFIKKKLKYPKEALLKKIEGRVYLKYKISPKGKVFDVIVISGIGFGCDKEAIRIVKLLSYSVPKNRKLKVTTYKRIVIKFKLPPATIIKKENKISINYIIVK